MSPSEIQATVLFADVSGSTGLYEQLGNERAQALIGGVLARMTDITHRLGGSVVKTIGDEVMSRFPTAEAGVVAATTIQEGLHKNPPRDHPVRVRIGLHHGAVLPEEGDLYGNAVNIAARMAAMARAGQILTTAETVDLLPAVLKAKARLFDRTQVKGIQAEVVAYQVVWEQEDEVTTIAPTGGMAALLPESEPLNLRCGTDAHRLDGEADAFILGRADTCHLAVPTPLASRQHARIEFRRGRFVLIDQSTNGTWVRLENGRDIFLRREEFQLWGRGVICLGGEVREGDPALVHFSAPA